ncbi:MAG TPA: gas vesicle protein K [Nocardioides sp.]|nr:gas vesicle protein K [Nocardioides sp.]
MNEGLPEAFLGIGPETGDRDLVRLVLTVVDLSRQLMEKQVSRDESGELTEGQREALSLALIRLEEAVEGFRLHYGLPLSDLDLGLDALAPPLPERDPSRGNGG